MTDKQWLITGGCGFLGTSIIRALLTEKGNKIRIIDKLLVGTRDDLAKVCSFDERRADEPETWGAAFSADPVELIVGDILDSDLALRAADGVDVIVHLAANTGVAPSVEDPRTDCMYNVVGTFNYLEAARQSGCQRFVFASSGAIVGECNPPLHEELPAHPVSPYGASKVCGEAYCSAYYRTFGIKTTALRFSNVYGPLSSHKNSLVARCIRRVMEGQHIEIYGDGENTRDFIYIDDLVNAVMLSATTDAAAGEVFQVATNEETTVNALVDMLIPVLESRGFSGITVKHEGPRLGDVRRNFADTSKAKNVLKWEPQVSLQQGLELTADWFLKSSKV